MRIACGGIRSFETDRGRALRSACFRAFRRSALLQQAFGVWGEKKLYGRTYMGTFRTTFIINENGVVEKIIGPKEIKTKDHANQILNK